MAAGNASWLVGSHGNWPSTTVTLDGTPYEVTASLGGIYLYHTTAALNVMAQLKTHLDTEYAGTNVVRLNKSGKVFISSDFIGGISITWTDTLLRDMLGFTQGNLVAVASATADDVSPWLFRQGRTETPLDGVLGSQGRLVLDVVGGVSRDGTVGTSVLGEQIVERLLFTHVALDRYQENADLDRQFRGWWKFCGAYGRKFFHYRQIAEDDASSDAVTWTTGLGPYAVDVDQAGGRLPGSRSPSFRYVEAFYDLEIPCHITPEYA